MYDRALLNSIKLLLETFSFINLNLKSGQQIERETVRAHCATGMESDLDVEDPIRDENEELAGTWIFKIAVRLENGRDTHLKRSS